MSSILTNNGAMVALQTLRSINKDLGIAQNEISTGQRVSTAKDNAAVFAISKSMESDVTGFEAIEENLKLGSATLSVAMNGAEQVGNLLNEIKGKIVSANEENVDRTAINNEVSSLIEQVDSVVNAAKFNGLNLLDGSRDGAGGFSVLAALNKSLSGVLSTTSISFDPSGTNLSGATGTALTIADVADNTVDATRVLSMSNQDLSAGSGATLTGDTLSVTLTAADAAAVTDGVAIGGFDFQTDAAVTGGANAVAQTRASDPSDTTGLVTGDSIWMTVGGVSARYTINEGDSQGDVAVGLRQGLMRGGLDTSQIDVRVATNANGAYLAIDNLTNRTDITVETRASRAGGGLEGLDTIDVSTVGGARDAIGAIELYISNTVNAQAQLGTTAKRLDIQSEFISTQIDSFKSGIGALTDADMEEVSARLQARQVQQQLAVQSLSIANQAPQTILSLFR